MPTKRTDKPPKKTRSGQTKPGFSFAAARELCESFARRFVKTRPENTAAEQPKDALAEQTDDAHTHHTEVTASQQIQAAIATDAEEKDVSFIKQVFRRTASLKKSGEKLLGKSDKTSGEDFVKDSAKNSAEPENKPLVRKRPARILMSKTNRNFVAVDQVIEEQDDFGSWQDFTKTRHPVIKKLPWIVCGVVVVVLIFWAVYIGWDRWFRYDDTEDIQGTWYVTKSDVSIIIDENTIQLTDDTAYEYSLDTQKKCIFVTFGAMSGTSRYRFSADRTELAIMEDVNYDFVGSLFDDLSWSWSNFVRSLQGEDALSPNAGDDQSSLLNRLSARTIAVLTGDEAEQSLGQNTDTAVDAQELEDIPDSSGDAEDQAQNLQSATGDASDYE